MKPDLILFDLDGTLIDSLGDLHAAVNRLLAEHDAAPLDAGEVRPMIGDGAARLVERALAARPEIDLDPAEAVTRYLALYEEAPTALTTAYPGVDETLAALARQGIPLAVCTNKPERPSRTVLAALGLDRHFERVVGGDTLPWRKPDRRVLDAMLADRGVSADSAMLVGDSEIDAAAAAAAGLPFVLMTYGYRRGPADAIPSTAALDRFADLLALID